MNLSDTGKNELLEIVEQEKQLSKEYIIDNAILEYLRGTTLFYPCSGNDVAMPIQIFGQHLKEIIFVDIAYFRNNNPEVCKKIILNKTNYIFNGAKIENSSKIIRGYGTINLLKRVESYTHVNSANKLDIIRIKGKGIDVLNDLHSIGVFFYRGDSSGDGGSRALWLCKPSFDMVLQRLINGGLIITDGSNCCHKLSNLAKFHWNREIGIDSIKLAKSFKYNNIKFDCIGYAGERYGPTLIWKITK